MREGTWHEYILKEIHQITTEMNDSKVETAAGIRVFALNIAILLIRSGDLVAVKIPTDAVKSILTSLGLIRGSSHVPAVITELERLETTIRGIYPQEDPRG